MELFNLNKKKADFIKIKVEKLVDWNEPKKTAPSWCRNRISCNLRICTMEISCGNSNKM